MTKQLHLYSFSATAIVLWSLLILFSGKIGILAEKKRTIELAKKEALITFNKDQAFREWATQHGGVYVPVSDKSPPNPYLKHMKQRNIRTTSGIHLTLMNPAYMMRQVMHDYGEFYGTKGRITALTPLNPINKPDEWEKKALTFLEARIRQEVLEVTHHQGESFLRLMRPMFTKKECLKCHAIQGHKENDLRGGVGVTVAMAPYLAMEYLSIKNILLSHTFFWLLGILGFLLFLFWEKDVIKKEDRFKNALLISNNNLKMALEEVKTLRGIIPICSYCKKIRDEEGGWNRLEAYIHSHSHATFSHGVCPECYKKEIRKINDIKKIFIEEEE